ncbi:MAG: D-2-hydroxyacid dehydrogenase [Methylocystaceae bacterium]
MVKVLITDGMDQDSIKTLRDHGFEVVEKFYPPEELAVQVKDFDILVVRSATKVNKAIIDGAVGGRLKFVIRGGVGVDNIDVKYAMENGIKVMNTPGASSASVAELTIAHMFAVARFLESSNVSMREGKWEKKKYEGVELAGKTLGLIGFGRIAREVAKRADALGMKVIYTDITGQANGGDQYEFFPFEDLLRRSDFISLHIPYDKEKGSVITNREFTLMKDGAYLVNCARGGLVNESDLIEALEQGKIAGACVDTFEEEPTPNEALIKHPRVSVTPHIGASTVEAQQRIGQEVVGLIIEHAPQV